MFLFELDLTTFDEIKFMQDKIVWRDSGKTIVTLKDIFLFMYRKPMNWFLFRLDSFYSQGIPFPGILYIATNSTKNLRGILKIKVEYDDVKKLPEPWQKKLEIYPDGVEKWIIIKHTNFYIDFPIFPSFPSF